MRKTFWQKRIPTLLGIFLIILGLGAAIYLGNKKTVSVVTKVNPAEEPQEVRITNISDSSFSVSYSTIETVTGSLNLGTDKNLGQTILDDRDQGVPRPHRLHFITVRNLSPYTTYFFTIISGQNIYNNDGDNFKATTGPLLDISASMQEPATGKITTSKGVSPQEAIIYLTTNDAQTISSLVNSDGSFVIPLNSLRNSTNSAYFSFGNDTVLKILAVSADEKSNVSTTINQISPIPTIILSKDYDFTKVQNNVSSQSASMIIPTPSPTATPSSQMPKILSPEKNQEFGNQQPTFTGTALPNQRIEIAIYSTQEITTQTYADSNGNWSYTPNIPILPGNHTISVTTTSPSGITQTISQSFIVALPINQQISTTLTPTTTNTPTPTLAPTFSPTTFISSETSTISPTLPASGNPIIITAGILGMILTVVGTLLFLFARDNNSPL